VCGTVVTDGLDDGAAGAATTGPESVAAGGVQTMPPSETGALRPVSVTVVMEPV
jgi:hypothetical protein